MPPFHRNARNGKHSSRTDQAPLQKNQNPVLLFFVSSACTADIRSLQQRKAADHQLDAPKDREDHEPFHGSVPPFHIRLKISL